MAGGKTSSKATAPLRTPRAADAAIAAEDDDDPAVAAVTDGGGGGISPRSASATPPPAGGPTLAETVAEMRARGEEPGVADADTLLSGEEEDNNGAVQAEAKRSRVKQRAFVKGRGKGKDKAAAATDSDDAEPEPKRKKSRAPASKMTVTRHPGKKARVKDTEPELISDSDDAYEARTPTSRHVGVAKSTIYKTFQANMDPIRRRFQSLMLIRDGWPIKAGATNKAVNYKLVLQAAKQALSKQDATTFNGAMEAAYKDPS